MDLKNAARKLWHSDVEEDQVYSGPYLVKGGHMDILVRCRGQMQYNEQGEAILFAGFIKKLGENYKQQLP